MEAAVIRFLCFFFVLPELYLNCMTITVLFGHLPCDVLSTMMIVISDFAPIYIPQNKVDVHDNCQNCSDHVEAAPRDLMYYERQPANV